MTRDHRPRRRRGDEGFTMTELLTTLVLMSIVGVVMLGFVENTMSVTARASASSRAEMEGQIALRTITQDVRSADPIIMTTAAPSGVPICPYAGIDQNNCIEFVVPRVTQSAAACSISNKLVMLPFTRYVYRLQNGAVLQDRKQYTTTSGCNTPASVVTGRVIIKNVQNPASLRLFTFYDRNNNAIAPGSSVRTATSVMTNLRVRYRKNAPLLSLSSHVALRNNRT